MSEVGEFSFAHNNKGIENGMGVPNGLAKIHTHVEENVGKAASGVPETPRSATALGTPRSAGAPGTPVTPPEVCTDDSGPTVRAKTLDELHSLQKKRSAPSTPKDANNKAFFLSDEERQRMQLQSISASLASLTRETGPKVIRGDPEKKQDRKIEHDHSVPHFTLQPNISDSALKFTHIMYNLSPGELYEQAIKYEKGSFITSTGALATLSGAKTGRSPRDKRVVREDSSEDDLWWGKGSPNIEMDEHTFLVNRERAVDYLNSLEKVFVNDQFLNWDPEHRIKVRIISARAYHALFMYNM